VWSPGSTPERASRTKSTASLRCSTLAVMPAVRAWMLPCSGCGSRPGACAHSRTVTAGPARRGTSLRNGKRGRARGVNGHKVQVAQVRGALAPVPRHVRLRRVVHLRGRRPCWCGCWRGWGRRTSGDCERSGAHQRELAAHKPVEDGGLADVGPPGYGHLPRPAPERAAPLPGPDLTRARARRAPPAVALGRRAAFAPGSQSVALPPLLAAPGGGAALRSNLGARAAMRPPTGMQPGVLRCRSGAGAAGGVRRPAPGSSAARRLWKWCLLLRREALAEGMMCFTGLHQALCVAHRRPRTGLKRSRVTSHPQSWQHSGSAPPRGRAPLPRISNTAVVQRRRASRSQLPRRVRAAPGEAEEIEEAELAGAGRAVLALGPAEEAADLGRVLPRPQ